MRSIRLMVLVVALLLALPTAAASADVWGTNDRKEDRNGIGDISRIRVDNAPRNLFLRTRFYAGMAEGDVLFYLDTVRRNPGPEFRVKVYLDEFTTGGAIARDALTVDRVDRFGARGRLHRRPCAGRSGWISRADNVNVTVPRACLAVGGHRPGAVRLSVSVFRVYGGPDFNGDWDHAPSRHRFGPWVAHR
jgi:hypothetical protein